MLHIEKVISYYQNCYKHEFKDQDFLNFFGTNIDKRIFLKNENELFKEEDTTFLNLDFGEELYKYIEIHKKTKSLLACSFFITGSITFLGKKRTICAPLILTPVELKLNNSGIYYLEYHFSENRINETLLTNLKSNFNLNESFVLEVKSLLKETQIQKVEIQEIAKKIQEYITIDSSSLEELPVLVDDKVLKKDLKKASLKIHPSIALGIIEKSKSNRDVLTELETIKENHLYNDTLEALFSRSGSKNTSSKKQLSSAAYVPSNLSAPQSAIIKSVKNESPCTVVVGPPGTGKSYTIASIAVDLVYNNKSVLICSKSEQAVNVLNHKISTDLGIKGLTLRVGAGRSYKTKVKNKLVSILSYNNPIEASSNYIKEREKELSGTKDKIRELEEEIKSREKKEIEKAELLLDYKPSFFKRIKKNYVSKKVLKEFPFWNLIELLGHYLQKRNSIIKKIVTERASYKIQQSLRTDRATLSELLTIAKSKNPEVKDGLLESINFKKIVDCFPIWISKTTDLNTFIPLENDLFDVAIVDEASQCDIATMIPVLARAKKIVVVGDPKQLKHISFLSSEIMEKTASDLGLIHEIDVVNYRKNSFLDFITSKVTEQENFHFLDEHYRSVPEIIKYSNAKFYDEKLKVMSTISIHDTSHGIHWVQCNGTKNKRGVNEAEAIKLLEDVETLIKEESDIPSSAATSIGILSPFRDQVNYLQRKLETFDLSVIKKHKILIGSPYDFQGEERDFMFLTFTIDNETSSAVFNYLNREDVFNVSITRAKQKQFLYYSFEAKNFSNSHLLVDYYADTKNYLSQLTENTYADSFADEVCEALTELGVAKDNMIVNYDIAGYTFDIVVATETKTICIDLIGYPGEMGDAFSLDQYRTLLRVNIQIIAMPYAYWSLNKQACIDYLKGKLK
ncbi:AAA domain-containing protein [Tenacibaculum sp. M341]|uniref:AAA domain-containing protein n=1 Tax=Tenacibaculum sp. M341 TaxID=2530339 RepID=UPI001043A57F|nr:AAA domain-containing protein [Tenacibaculum sp. M341]TCI93080.1 hypothetical protein EYW44_05535 [Tenacibaculum sp. M341]